MLILFPIDPQQARFRWSPSGEQTRAPSHERPRFR